MKEQIVIKSYASKYSNAMNELNYALRKGFRVIMANPVGEDIEYILEREVEDFTSNRAERIGKWYMTARDDGGADLLCSECGHHLGIRVVGRLGVNENIIRYCSSCGARMKNVEEVKEEL